MKGSIFVKRLFKVFIMLALVLSFLSFNSSTIETVFTKIAHVNIKSGTFTVRSGASDKEKKFADSYLKDKTKVYTYMHMETGKKLKYEYAGIYNYGNERWDLWKSSEDRYIVYEDENGLYSGLIESEHFVDIIYPIKIGESWLTTNKGMSTNHRATSVSKTVKTPAGTFKNCIEMKTDDGYTSYYAKNVGYVKGVYKGKTYSQLIKLENK